MPQRAQGSTSPGEGGGGGGGLGPRRSKCFDLPRDLVLKRLSRLNLLGDLPVQESQEVNMLRPAQGFSLQEAVMPQLA